MNMKIHLLSGAIAFALTQGAVAQQATSQKDPQQPTSPSATSAAPTPDRKASTASSSDADYSRSMERLTKAAQNLREAVQAMATQPAGQGRNEAMRQANDALLETQQAMVQLPPELRKAANDSGAKQAPTSASGAGQKSSSGASADSTITANVPVVVMVPVRLSMQEEAKGCWAKLYDQQKYQGDNLMLLGPVDLPRMRGPMGMSWENKIESVETGPKAQVVIYDNENFRDRNKVVSPGSKVPELDEKLGFFDNVRSLKVSCS
jgi:Beta/Gamma crystallin